MKKKPGRPRLPRNQVLKVVPVRLSSVEHAMYKEVAQRNGQSLSEWIRGVLQIAVFGLRD